MRKHFTLEKAFTVFFIFLIHGITVHGQVPVANFTGTPVSGCSPLIVNFQDLSGGGPTSWNWDFGNSNTSTLQNPTATYFNPGTYTVSLTATNANGSNTLTRTQYVTVYEPPTVNFTGSPLAGCFPWRVEFTDLSTPGSGNTNVSWNWDFGNGITSTLQNPAVIYNTAGNFTVTLRVTNDKGCIRTFSRPAYIAVTAGVTANFTHTQPTVCSAPATVNFSNTSTGPGTLTYQWDFGDGSPVSTALSPVHTYLTNGNYNVRLITTSSGGCEDTAWIPVPISIGGFVNSFTLPASVCINEPASFQNTSTPTPVSTTWNFGDGGTATGSTTTHSYSAPGTYTVWMYNNFSNCRDSASQTIVVNPRPVAAFSAPATVRCQPDFTVNFQDQATGAISWQWNFGDGSPTSNDQNPVHIYTSYGDFDVTLIVTNSFGCTDTLIRNDYIRVRRATISVPLLPVRGCIPFTINPVPVISSLDAITSYEWDFGDGIGTSTLANPTYTYNVQGTYTVRLIITTSTGCRDTLILPGSVRVGSRPNADFSAVPVPVCAFQTVSFTDLSTSANVPPVDEWFWDFGDGGTALTQNPTHIYADTGFFAVTLIAFNNGCPDTIVRSDYVYVLPPVARFDITPDCNNRMSFTFTDRSLVNPALGTPTWEWDFGHAGPGSTSTLQNPVHIFPGPGSYTVELIVTNGGCADTITHTVNAVDESPDFIANRTVACKRGLINFSVTNTNFANITNYAWDFGDGVTANTTTPNIVHTYVATGNFTVTLVTTDLNGCINTRVKTNFIRINGPRASFNLIGTRGCVGLNTTVSDLSTTDGVNALVNWQFDFGDGTIRNFGAPPFTHVYNTPGTFTVKLILTDAAGCVDSVRIIDAIIVTDPTPDFFSRDTLSCPGATVRFTNTTIASPGYTSTWDFGDGNTSTANSPTNIYLATGSYNVTLTIRDVFGCIESVTKNLYVRVELPQPSFAMSDTAGACTPLQVQFTNTSTYFTTSFWDFGVGQGTSTLTNPIHYYAVPGTYTIKLIVSSPGGCIDSTFRDVTVYDTSGSRLSYVPVGGCSPLTINLNTNTIGEMNSYFWDFGDGNTISTTLPNVSHTYQSFGNFLPKMIMQDPSGCLIPLEGTDTVFVIGANSKFGIDNNLFCDSAFVNFADSSTFNDPIVNYNWDFGDGGTSDQQNPTHQYTSPGNYQVSLAIETVNGCRDTSWILAPIKVVQSPIVDIGGDSVICVNSPLLHSGVFLAVDTSIVSWAWNFPNGNTSSQQNPPLQTYTTAGSFVVTTVATNSSGCTDSESQTILVNPLPTITMPGQMTVQPGFPVMIPATYSPNTASWVWTPSAGLSCTDCPTPLAGPQFNTFYQVYFTDSNQCSNSGSIEVIVVCKDGNLFIPNTFSPNGDGNNEIFYPRGRGLYSIQVLRIFNRWGEVVFEKRDFSPNDPMAGWNGTFKGKKAQADVYVYQAEVICENGDIIKLNGNIALIL